MSERDTKTELEMIGVGQMLGMSGLGPAKPDRIATKILQQALLKTY